MAAPCSNVPCPSPHRCQRHWHPVTGHTHTRSHMLSHSLSLSLSHTHTDTHAHTCSPPPPPHPISLSHIHTLTQTHTLTHALSVSLSLTHTPTHTRSPLPNTLTYALSLSLSLSHTHTHARAHTHTDIHIHAHTHTYAHTRTHSHKHARARAHTRTLTHYIGMVFGQWLTSEAAAGRHRVTQQTNALSLSVRRRSRAVHTAVGPCCHYATGGCPACRPRRRGSLFASRHGAAWYYVPVCFGPVSHCRSRLFSPCQSDHSHDWTMAF